MDLNVFDKIKVLGISDHPTFQNLQNVDKLCTRCYSADWSTAQLYLSIADEWSFYPKIPIFSPYPTLGQIKKSVDEGCHLCSLVLSVLLSLRYRASIGVDPVPEDISELCEDSEVKIDVEGMAKEPPVWLTITIINSTREGDNRWVDFSLPLAVVGPNSASSVHFGAPAEEIAQFWLDDCRNSHNRCSSEIPKLPRRVIDVSEDPLRLFVSEKNAEAEYATLSYTIGGAHLVTTTNANICDRQSGFDMNILPKTIQDAIWWTRRLGLQYLWIDSLCILQDALADWEIELASMSDIYRNSTVTIAATAAINAFQGCKPTRNKLVMVPCKVCEDVVVLPDFNRRTWIFDSGSLDSRAWCFQEVQLARRVLRVGGEEIAWQCRSCKRLESRPDETQVHDIESQATFFGSRVLDAETHQQVGRDETSENQRQFALWYTLVRAFANRKLSFSADKLPAFSGMAEYFQQMLGATYCAGIWQEDIFHGLIFIMLLPGIEIPYRAPSWSWASVEGGHLGWNLHLLSANDFVADLLDVRVEVSGLNPFGRIRSAKLTLYAPISPLPSQCYGDDSEIGPWKWAEPLLTFDRGMPEVGCVLLRLHERGCLILQPNGTSTFRRVGFIRTPSEPQTHTRAVIDALNSYQWEDRVVSII